MASLLPAIALLIAGVAARKPDHGTGFGEDNHGAAERVAMFAQMRFCVDSVPGLRQGPTARVRRSTALPAHGIDRQRPMRAQPRQVQTRSSARMQERLRFPARETTPGRLILVRAHSAADLSPSGDFCRVTPLARKRPTKMAPCCRSSPWDRGVSRGEMPTWCCWSFDPMCRQKGDQKEPDPSWLADRLICGAACTPSVEIGQAFQ